MITLILSLFLSQAQAADHWLCTEEASQLQGTAIYACGVAVASLESEARAQALSHATDEFNHLCGLSDSCRGHAVTVEPKRTTCEPFGNQIKCYRGVIFTPLDKLSESGQAAATEAQFAKPKPQAKAHPIIRVGMTKDDLLAQLGMPTKVYPATVHSSTMYLFKKTTPGCGGYFNCAVYLDENKVSSYDPDWQVEYTDAMEH